VLNACRAWRFTTDGALVSKVAGGEWALGRVPGRDRGLVTAALARQRCQPAADLDPAAVGRFVREVLTEVERS
jgi:streptomycin 3"-adenylyltransferase